MHGDKWGGDCSVERWEALSCSALLPRPASADVLFVIGPHKSGTSLLTELLAHSYLDVSRVTNPSERGYGKAVRRYLTRECSVVRKINARYRSNLAGHTMVQVGQPYDHATRGAMEAFFRTWSVPIVIKAPFFAYSLHEWLQSASTCGRRACICVTQRSVQELAIAWARAPFTRTLLAEGELPRLTRAIRSQVEHARAVGVDVRSFNYGELAPEASAG